MARELDAKNSEAFVFQTGDPVCAIYVQQHFFSENPVIKGPRNYARIIIHEVAHKAAGTGDYSYATQGMRPGGVNLNVLEALENSDSWAFCILDMADMLVDVEKARALMQ